MINQLQFADLPIEIHYHIFSFLPTQCIVFMSKMVESAVYFMKDNLTDNIKLTQALEGL